MKIYIVVKCDGLFVRDVMKNLEELGFERRQDCGITPVRGGVIFEGSIDEESIPLAKKVPHVIGVKIND